MDRLEIKAPAKINLFLKVLGRRPDGYHDIFSWFQAISLFDYLHFEKCPDGVELAVKGNYPVPTGEDNLVKRATRLMSERFRLKGGLKIILQKNIPVAAGMAGGSSDAAATIYALNRLYDLNLNNSQMAELGLELGSDMPFFFSTGRARVSGRGEKIRDIFLPLDYEIILGIPPLAISTREAYAGLKMGLTIPHPDIKFLPCKDFKGLVAEIENFGNDFEGNHFRSFPELGRIRDIFVSAGAAVVRMTGSGPTIFGLFEDMPEGEVISRLSRGNWRIVTAKPIVLPAWD